MGDRCVKGHICLFCAVVLVEYGQNGLAIYQKRLDKHGHDWVSGAFSDQMRIICSRLWDNGDSIRRGQYAGWDILSVGLAKA